MRRFRLHQISRGALHDASGLGLAAAVVAILSSGSVDIDERDPRGFTPLMCAAFAGHASVTRVLLSKGADALVTEHQGATALFFAVQEGHLEAVKLLVEAGSDLEARNGVDHTPLFKAAVKGHTEVVRVLMEASANPDNPGPTGSTPLWAAALQGHRDIVTMLLRAKANPLLAADKEEDYPTLPLDAAAQSGHAGVVLELARCVGIKGCGGPSRGIDALCWAAKADHVGVVAALIDVGVVDAAGRALCEAAEYGRSRSVKFLLQEQRRKRWVVSCRGGYVHAADHASRTPLCCGIDACSPRVVRCLLDAGANAAAGVHNSSTSGMCNETPLAYATGYIDNMKADGNKTDGSEEHLRKLEAIRRLLLRVNAVHAVSWLWLRRAASPPGGAANSAERARRTKMAPAPAAGTAVRLMLPVLRRRAAKPRVLLGALWRYSAKLPRGSATQANEICCSRGVGFL